MPITTEELASLLAAIEIKAKPVTLSSADGSNARHAFMVMFGTESYVSSEGQSAVPLFMQTLDDGEYLEIFAESLYDISKCEHKTALFDCLARIAYRTKLVQFEHNEKSESIRIAADVAIADGTLTPGQLNTMVNTVAMAIEAFHPVIAHAMETGEIDFDRQWVLEDEDA
jgi:hypothetical protein